MPGPDLTAATARVEELMDDECRIVRDEEGTADSTLNEATGELTPPADDTSLLYAGPCKFKIQRATEVDEGGTLTQVLTAKLDLPVEVTPVPGDEVTITKSRRDPSAVGLPFRVSTYVLHKTYAVQHTVHCEHRGRVTDRAV